MEDLVSDTQIVAVIISILKEGTESCSELSSLKRFVKMEALWVLINLSYIHSSNTILLILNQQQNSLV